MFNVIQTRGPSVGAAVCVAVALAWAAAGTTASAEPPPRVVRFMGASAAETLTGADRVEVFRVSTKRAREDDPEAGGYVVTATGRSQDTAFAGRLAAVLLDEKSYRFDANRVGGFEPVVVLKVWKGQRWVEVLLSFATDELVVRAPGAKDGAVRSAQADAGPARRELLGLVRQALPDDARLKALPETMPRD